jgi:hypothetical protein
MLLEFTVGNFLSFKDKKTFSLEAGNIKELKENILQTGKYKVLRSAVIYGANSSGKSNFIKALDFMMDTIRVSSKLNSTDKLNVKPFLLNTETENLPSYFEALFLVDNNRYRYGFELDDSRIHSEWLYILNENSKKEDLYFIRNLNGIGVADIFKDAKGLEEKTRDNALFIATVDQFNNETAHQIIRKFGLTTVISGINHEDSINMTNTLYSLKTYKKEVEEFIKNLDLGFKSFNIDDDTNKKFKNRLLTLHNKYNNQGEVVAQLEFIMEEQESSGTNKIFDICGDILFAHSLGHTLIIDELDAKLHPILTQAIIKLFNNVEANPNGGQLIFSTHDTNLLGANLFRRDQIWFTEKDNLEATDLYSLLEFKDENGKTIRNDRSFESDYIRGRYGAIPYISNYQKI